MESYFGKAVKAIIDKLLAKAASSTVWATVAGNYIGLEYIQDETVKGFVIVAINISYMVVEAYRKVRGIS